MARGNQAHHRYRRWALLGSQQGDSAGRDGRAAEAQAASEAPPRHIETLAALVLSIAAVATAWSAYQSTRWSGIMATAFNEAGALRSESVRSSNEAGIDRQVSINIAADWLWAVISGEQPVADELRKRMPPSLSGAMDQWLGDWQPEQALPEGDPFTTGGYHAPATDRALVQEKEAEEQFAAARKANQRSDNYVLTGVLFALALFFAGISSRVASAPGVTRMVYGATFVMVLGVVLLIVQPKSIGI